MLSGSAPLTEDSDTTSLKPPSTTTTTTTNTSTRNSYGYWSGRKSAASTPNLSQHHYTVSYDFHDSSTGQIYDREALGQAISASFSSVTSPSPTPATLTTVGAEGGPNRSTLSLAQVPTQVSSMGSMASVDSASSATFHTHRKRSESTGGGLKVIFVFTLTPL